MSRPVLGFAILAGVAAWFANGRLPPWKAVTMGLGAAAFWLVVGLAVANGWRRLRR